MVFAETFTLLIPNFYGGPSAATVTKDSESYKIVGNKKITNTNEYYRDNIPMYFGDQPSVGGPTYAGSIIIFLFVLALLFVKSEMRIWLLIATIMSLMLAWGKNFMFLTDFFIDYFPAYNKFRAVSSIQVIADNKLLAFIGLNKFLISNEEETSKEEKIKIIFLYCWWRSIIFCIIFWSF